VSVPRRRGAGPAAVLAIVALVLAGGPAGAQDPDPFVAFGGIDASARSGGVQVSYDVKGVLPLPPPLLEVTVPTARASSSSGPSSLAFGSLAYPGDLVGNLPSLVEQSAAGAGRYVPPYPIATMAAYPSGPAVAQQEIGTGAATVAASAASADATSTLARTGVPSLVEVDGVTTRSRTGLEDGKLVARSHTEVAEVSLLFGLVELHDVVTDVVAATDGTTGAAGGTTTVASATVLGQPARLGPAGLELVGTTTPLLEPVQAALARLLTGRGLRIEAAPLTATHDAASADVDAGGLVIGLDLDGSGDNVLAQLLALVPSDQLPGSAIPGVPVNTSPQALVNLLKETHVVRVALGPARVHVDAAPTASSEGDGDGGAGSAVLPGADLGSPSLGPPADAGFTTPLPPLVAQPAVATDAGGAGGGLVPGRAIGPGLALLLSLSLPLWAAGARRLLDAELAAPGPGCGATDRPTRAGGARGRRR
jgi:hypothetical protein